jgi:hypothetical protein
MRLAVNPQPPYQLALPNRGDSSYYLSAAVAEGKVVVGGHKMVHCVDAATVKSCTLRRALEPSRPRARRWKSVYWFE